MKNINGWELTTWYGNPLMDVVSYLKIVINPLTKRKTKLWVWVTNNINNELVYSYTVNSGASSEYSYTGGFREKPQTMVHAINMLDTMLFNKEVFK